MQLNLFGHGLALLCRLASVTFAVLDARLRGLAVVMVGFALTAVVVGGSGVPDPAWGGGVVAALAIVAILRPHVRPAIAACGGVLAAIWAAMLQIGGLPILTGVVLAITAPTLAIYLTRRHPEFAPQVLLEEALVVIVLLGVMVAIAPGVVAGWRSAAVLNLQQPLEAASHAVPTWALFVSLGAAALGGVHTVWMRR